MLFLIPLKQHDFFKLTASQKEKNFKKQVDDFSLKDKNVTHKIPYFKL